nr:BV-like protein [Cotesia vestalis bracovirus]
MTSTLLMLTLLFCMLIVVVVNAKPYGQDWLYSVLSHYDLTFIIFQIKFHTSKSPYTFETHYSRDPRNSWNDGLYKHVTGGWQDSYSRQNWY